MRRALTVAVLLGLCMGFQWPGRLPRLKYELTRADAPRRREVARMLAGYSGDEVREALLDALEDQDLEVRLEAAAALGALREPQAQSALEPWLRDGNERVRAVAATALGQIGDAQARPALERALGDTTASVRAAAASALRTLADAEVVPALVSSLDDADASVRLAALASLRGNHDARIASALARRCHDDDPLVRAATMQTLGESSAPQALALLTAGLSDASPEVRLEAARALGALGAPGNVGAIDALRGQLHAETALASVSLSALGRIDDPRAQALIVEQLDSAQLSQASQDVLVERVRRGGAQPSSDAHAPSVVQALDAVLRAPSSPRQRDAATQTLVALAPLTSIAIASSSLRQLLHDDPHASPSTLQALALTFDPDALEPLLEHAASVDAAGLDAALAALTQYFAVVPPDGRAADPLLARLAQASGSARRTLITLLGTTGAQRAQAGLLPLLVSGSHGEQIAALQVLTQLATPESRAALWPLLHAPDLGVRYAAAQALQHIVTFDDVNQLLDVLRHARPGDPHAALITLGGALARLDAAHQLPDDTRKLALAILADECTDLDRALSSRGLAALRQWAPPEGAKIIAHLLRSPALRIRTAAAYALGSFPSEDSRRLLRYLLQRANPRLATAAVAALGEIGDQRDVTAIVHASVRSHWPVAGAAAHALARFSQRGVVKQHSLQRALCELSSSHDPYVRANAAAAMASMAAPACSDSISPLAWLDAQHASAVRVAAAGWARAAARAGNLAPDEAQRALRGCASDQDRAVASACSEITHARPQRGPQRYLYEVRGQHLADRLVAVRMWDGSVLLARTDSNAELQVPDADPASAVLLEDPTATPREPK